MNSLYKSSTYIGDLKRSIKNTINFSNVAGKRIFITGASGLVGSYIVDMFCLWNYTVADNHNKKIEIYAGSRNLENLKRRFEGVLSKEQLHFVQQDLTQPLQIDFKVDYVVHAASNAYPAAFNQDPIGTIMSNIFGTHELLKYAYEQSIERFLFVSTGEIYGEGEANLEEFTEEYSGYVNTMNARSCYPSAKRTAETICAAYKKQYGLNIVVARLCHTYGPNVTAADNRATVQFLNNAIHNQDIILKSKGHQLRSYCYIGDCASGILSVLIAGENGEAYNIANRDSRITIADFASISAELTGMAVKFELPNETSNQEQTPISKAVLSSDKIEKLGWKASYDALVGIKHNIQILKEMQKPDIEQDEQVLK